MQPTIEQPTPLAEMTLEDWREANLMSRGTNPNAYFFIWGEHWYELRVELEHNYGQELPLMWIFEVKYLFGGLNRAQPFSLYSKQIGRMTSRFKDTKLETERPSSSPNNFHLHKPCLDIMYSQCVEHYFNQNKK